MIDEVEASARQPRRARRFCILLPVLRPPHMLPYAIRSVQSQTEGDFELCVVCDGAPPETAELAATFAKTDPRIHVFAFPKGKRHGEAYRAAVLEGARADFVAHLGDDDIWLTNHLANVAALLAKADFISVPGFTVQTDGRLQTGPFGDLKVGHFRRKMLNQRWNFFGPTEAAYRLDAYRKLPEGWAPGPEDLWSDLNMWRKFLRHPGLRFHSGMDISTLKFATPDWKDLSLSERAAANKSMWESLQDPATHDFLQAEARAVLARSVSGRHKIRLLASNPVRYLPIVLRKKFGEKPIGRPLF